MPIHWTPAVLPVDWINNPEAWLPFAPLDTIISGSLISQRMEELDLSVARVVTMNASATGAILENSGTVYCGGDIRINFLDAAGNWSYQMIRASALSGGVALVDDQCIYAICNLDPLAKGSNMSRVDPPRLAGQWGVLGITDIQPSSSNGLSHLTDIRGGFLIAHVRNHTKQTLRHALRIQCDMGTPGTSAMLQLAGGSSSTQTTHLSVPLNLATTDYSVRLGPLNAAAVAARKTMTITLGTGSSNQVTITYTRQPTQADFDWALIF